MNREILFHTAVQTEIREILDYDEEISQQLADDFWVELTNAFEYARMFPERHHFDPSGKRRSNLSRFPYHFLFRTSFSQVKVTVVRNNSRSSSYGSRRE